jgi:cytochrome oxidase assembly protein ShyY1
VTAQRLVQVKTHGAFSFRPAYLLFAAFAISLCLFLSHWQWQRAQAAEAHYQSYLQQQEKPPVTLADKPAEFQRVSINGHLERLFLLDNQMTQGQVGWHVLGLMTSESKPVLVNLGWTPKAEAKPTLSDFAGIENISGRIKTPEPGLMLAEARDDPAWPAVLQQIEIPLLNQHLDIELLPFVIYADPAPVGLATVKAAPENKYPMHVGYAVQWLLIGFACGLMTFIACRRRET